MFEFRISKINVEVSFVLERKIVRTHGGRWCRVGGQESVPRAGLLCFTNLETKLEIPKFENHNFGKCHFASCGGLHSGFGKTG